MRTGSRTVVTAAIGAGVLGALAGCASTAQASEAPPSTAPARDGTYSADGGYMAPDGPETVHVTLTVTSGIVRSVTVRGSGSTPNAQYYQSAFASGISSVVVGKKLAGLMVGAVSGSSLTGQGFDQALNAIRSEAAK